MASGEPKGQPRRLANVTETPGADAVPATAPGEPELTADQAVTQLYINHYRSLVRLAALLVRDEPTAEEVVQDCFIAMHDGWRRLRDEEKALSYLKQAIVNRSKSVLRHRNVMEKYVPQQTGVMPSAETVALSQMELVAVQEVLRTLPPRQRQAMALKVEGHSTAEIAGLLGIKVETVRATLSFARDKMRRALSRREKPEPPGIGGAAWGALAL